jgi:hypothetical protein
MASFAKIGLNNKVIEVLSVVNEVLHDANGVEQESIGIDFLTKLTGYPVWVQTSYNNNFRKNHAGIGYTYDEDRDAFIPKKPYQSWILNEDNLSLGSTSCYATTLDDNQISFLERIIL